jgi:hypothetical protein
MLDRKSHYSFYPKPSGDVGRDRNARTLQFASLLFASALAFEYLSRRRGPTADTGVSAWVRYCRGHKPCREISVGRANRHSNVNVGRNSVSFRSP